MNEILWWAFPSWNELTVVKSNSKFVYEFLSNFYESQEKAEEVTENRWSKAGY